MSFKRADDDCQAQNILRRRRVGDLLREDIEDDEVSRLSNGRLACMVCSHRPIFDTLAVFHVHRQGKKHQLNTVYKAEKKQELEDLIVKRKQEQFLRTGNTDIQQAPAEIPKGLGFGKAYDPRTKKHRKPHERKTILDIHMEEVTHNSGTDMLETTDKDLLPGNRRGFSSYKRKVKIDVGSKAASQTVTDTKAIKESVESPADRLNSQESKEVQTFNKSKGKSIQQSNWFKPAPDDDIIVNPNNLRKLVANKGPDQDVKHYIARRKKLKTEIGNKIEIGPFNRTVQSNTNIADNKSTVDWQKFQKYKAAIVSGTTKSSKLAKEKETCVRGKLESKHTEGNNKSPNINTEDSQVFPSDKADNTTQSVKIEEMDKKTKAERELQLRGAGWKRDWTGKWVRDEEAEFDSDEETPVFP